MSLEFALEKYPMEVVLKDNESYKVRPIRKEDGIAYYDFLMAIPEQERLFIKERVSNREIFDKWFAAIDFEVNTTLVLVKDGRIFAEGNLHQRGGGWKRHIGLISVLVRLETRGIGMSKVLVEELVEIARHTGLSKVEAQFNGEREIAIKSFAGMGFTELMRLKDYVQDMDAQFHDYVLMGMDLLTDEEFASAY